jgi:serine-type D-Ala-D-Ala carboxypeptidase
MNWSPVHQVVENALGEIFPVAAVQIRVAGQVVFEGAWGWLDPETRREPATRETLFDLASLTKLFTLTAAMTFVERGALALDQPVRDVLSALDGPRAIKPYEDPLHPGAWIEIIAPTDARVDAGAVTFRQLLAHNAGLPGWRPLFQLANRAQMLDLVLTTSFAYPTGTRVVYSDVGFILLGLALERLAQQPLDQIIRARVLDPLQFTKVQFNPRVPTRCAPTELCAWRGRRLRGEVHDENAAALGGIAGHAGLFGTADAVATLGQMYLDGGALLLSPATMAEMRRLQAEDGMSRRGLGWVLWSPDPQSSGYPYSPRAFGHTGFTGTSLWIDPARDLVVGCLTNRVYYGRDPAGITAFRVEFARAVVEALA